jgi:hypothetical protein
MDPTCVILLNVLTVSKALELVFDDSMIEIIVFSRLHNIELNMNYEKIKIYKYINTSSFCF